MIMSNSNCQFGELSIKECFVLNGIIYIKTALDRAIPMDEAFEIDPDLYFESDLEIDRYQREDSEREVGSSDPV